MADYDPLIPAAPDKISQSQSDIQNNFAELNTIFDEDHQTWNATPNTSRGKHRKLSFPVNRGSDPSVATDVGILFPKADTNDSSAQSQIYWRNQQSSGTTFQLTNRFYSATNGYFMEPFGRSGTPSLMYMWGVVPAASFTNIGAGGSFFDVIFPVITNYVFTVPQTQGFPNNLLNVQLTPSYDDATAKVAHVDSNSGGTGLSPTKISFRILMTVSNSSFTSVYWYAIGN